VGKICEGYGLRTQHPVCRMQALAVRKSEGFGRTFSHRRNLRLQYTIRFWLWYGRCKEMGWLMKGCYQSWRTMSVFSDVEFAEDHYCLVSAKAPSRTIPGMDGMINSNWRGMNNQFHLISWELETTGRPTVHLHQVHFHILRICRWHTHRKLPLFPTGEEQMHT
jgi:hypothetical protein